MKQNDYSALKPVELLAPAGDLERLRYAIDYGADAVYIGGEVFGLRASAKNFTIEEIREGLQYAHDRGKRVYLTLNMIPHNDDLSYLPEYLKQLATLDLDAVILADPGTLMLVREHLPHMEIHLSTQANNTNSGSAKFWHQNGVKRIVLARELSFDEIVQIRRDTPPSLEFEAFVHGAMCISYSGRCLLSNYMTGRDSNRGDCAQPCRWSYHLVEKGRPGEYFPIEENEAGTFIFNSKDLCMIDRIPELIRSGLHSLKIEGRMKTIYYVASVVRVYREAIDRFMADPENFVTDPAWMQELEKTSHREYTTGFYDGKPGADGQLYKDASYVRNYDFVGIVLSYDPETKTALVEQRNHFKLGQELEIIGPSYFETRFVLEAMEDASGNAIDVAPHARMKVRMRVPEELKPGYLIRRQA